MRKLIIGTALIMSFTAPVFAQDMIQLPSEKVMTPTGFINDTASREKVENIKSMHAGTWILLQGNIVRQTGNNTYTFQDETGTFSVEIDKRVWGNRTVTAKNIVQLQGIIDKGWFRRDMHVKSVDIIS